MQICLMSCGAFQTLVCQVDRFATMIQSRMIRPVAAVYDCRGERDAR